MELNPCGSLRNGPKYRRGCAMSKISISYRWQDSSPMARLICDRLSTRYGSDSVFMDVEKIQPGEDFRKHIAEALQECDVLIVIVGKKWLGQRKSGHTTINDESDWVRIEVETALERNIKIIPVLINRANMPRADQLPESLREFVYRSALRIDAGADFDDHMDRLIESIDHTLESVRNRPENPKAPAQTGKKIEHAFLPTFPKSTVEDAPATESAAGSSGPNMQEPLFQAGVLGGYRTRHRRATSGKRRASYRCNLTCHFRRNETAGTRTDGSAAEIQNRCVDTPQFVVGGRRLRSHFVIGVFRRVAVVACYRRAAAADNR